MKKLFSIFIMLGIMMISTTCFASLYEDLKNDPNYIYYGGGGTGISFFMDKSSLIVNKYEPPIYIIAFIRMDYSTGFPKGGVPESVHPKVIWYKYNYNLRRMYWSKSNIDGTFSWEYIDTKNANIDSALNSIIAGGEIAFYLAYNINFYKDGPLSWYAKSYFETLK